MNNSKSSIYYSLSILILLIYIWGLDFLLGSDIWSSLSTFQYELLILVLNLMFIGFTLCILWNFGNKEIFSFRFKSSYVGYFFLLLIGHLGWSILTSIYLPQTQNQSAINESSVTLDQLSNLLQTIGLLFVIPIAEELIFRGLVMDIFSSLKNYYIDVLLSSILFALPHVLSYGWITSDFIYYFIPGVFIALYFRKTNCIYYVMVYHMFWNSIPYLVRMLQ